MDWGIKFTEFVKRAEEDSCKSNAFLALFTRVGCRGEIK
jgi:hypothetical protein